MISTVDLRHWTKPISVIQEIDTHFSFPYTFEDNGEVYMIPETGWAGEIRLYKATDDTLTKFEKDTVLFKRVSKPEGMIFDYADSIVFKKDGVYYLFTSTFDKDGYELRLYTSESLKGKYQEHPRSPICHNLIFGRNAGSIIDIDGNLYRPTQDCSKVYGGQVNLMKITNISLNDYTEEIFAQGVLPKDDPFYRQGGHQLNFANFKGKIIMATDAKRDKAFYGTRLFHKILRTLNLSKY